MSVLAWHPACAQVVAFGASNVYGWNVDAAEAFPAQLESALRAQGYPITVLNAGMFGNTTVQMRARMDTDIPSGTTIVLLDVSGGLYNDSLSGVSREQGKGNLQAITAALQARGIKVVPVDFATVPVPYRQGDGRHLTPEGHEWIASQLFPEITTLLGPPPSPAEAQGSPAVIPACIADARGLCADATGDGATQRACMREHRTELSTDCRNAITSDTTPR